MKVETIQALLGAANEHCFTACGYCKGGGCDRCSWDIVIGGDTRGVVEAGPDPGSREARDLLGHVRACLSNSLPQHHRVVLQPGESHGVCTGADARIGHTEIEVEEVRARLAVGLREGMDELAVLLDRSKVGFVDRREMPF